MIFILLEGEYEILFAQSATHDNLAALQFPSCPALARPKYHRTK